jgi:hypothetical protein
MRAALLITSLLAFLGLVGSTALAGSDAARGRVAGSMAELRGVNFVSACRFSHRATDDPIVAPGVPGASHDHSFVGNRSTRAGSTLQTLLMGRTTCHRPADTAAYWMPTLLVDGAAVAPRGATIYYRRRTLDPVRPFPPGLKVIAGDARATTAQGSRVTFWNCGAAGGVEPSSTVPTCPDTGARSLRLHVMFPDCWNGSGLDSADHRSHLAYSVRGRCPATHPVAVPAIALIYRYPTTGGAGASLSSGGQLTAHADFFNAWKRGALTRLVNRCLNRLRHCARAS